MRLLHGFRVSGAEAFVYGDWLIKLQLLKMGIPYDTVMSLDEDEANTLLGVQAAVDEYMREQAAT